MSNIAFQLEDSGEPQQAEQVYLSMLRQKVDVTTLYNLGGLYQRHGLIDKAAAVFRDLLKIAPDDRKARAIFGHILLDIGRAQKAVEQFGMAGDVSTSLVAACHLEDTALVEELHASWGQSLVADIELPETERIAFISPNFNGSTVAKFFLPIVGKDHYCYSDSSTSDGITERIKAKCGHWRDISPLSDNEVIQQIEIDKIGIVIDLCGHWEGGKRLNMIGRFNQSFGYIRYPRPTGLPHQTMLDCFVYEGAQAIEPRGTSTGARTVFGSVNRPAKFTDALLSAWATIITESRGKLRVLVPGGENSRALRLRIEAAGIARESLELIPTGRNYWDFLRGCDVLLDSFAYSGVTTVADALWVGVPVVALDGDAPQQRLAGSILRSAQLHHLVATSAAEYVAIATGTHVRGARLRRHVENSGMVDGNRFGEIWNTMLNPKC